MNQIRTALHRTNRGQLILELVFEGGQWQVDSEIRDGIAEAIKSSPPAEPFCWTCHRSATEVGTTSQASWRPFWTKDTGVLDQPVSSIPRVG